jgi:hypothetical protein
MPIWGGRSRRALVRQAPNVVRGDGADEDDALLSVATSAAGFWSEHVI